MRYTLHSVIIFAVTLLSPAVARSQAVERVRPGTEPLLRSQDASDRDYYKLRIGDTVSYFHQRVVGDALVERDFIRYQFNVPSGALIERTIRWREDLPATTQVVVTQAQAEALVAGEVQYSALYFIAPDSYVFPITPTPVNPCWTVHSRVGGWPVVTVIDAITGDNLGHGIPPPAEGFTLTGPQDIPDCAEPWWSFVLNAYSWFTAMGYASDLRQYPTTSMVQSYIQSADMAVFYEVAHGSSSVFTHGCPDETTSTDVLLWLLDYASVPFAFLASCKGLCNTYTGTFAYSFRKGEDTGAAVVGYCDMDTAPCASCWSFAIDWQDAFFQHLAAGNTVEYSFNQANLAIPVCAAASCMRWAGDGALTLVPKLVRSLCGDVWDGQLGPLEDFRRPYFVVCDLHVPAGQTLTFGYGISVEPIHSMRIQADGTAQTPAGNVWFVREKDHTTGVKVGYFGRMRIRNGGALRVYE